MPKRADTLRRIAGVQNDIRKIGEIKLATLQRQHLSAQATETRLVSYLDENHIYTPAYMKTLADKLQAVGRAKRRLGQVIEDQSKALLECRRQTKQVERALETAVENARRLDERRDLDATIETEMNRKAASLP